MVGGQNVENTLMNRNLVIAVLSFMLMLMGALVLVLNYRFERNEPWRIALTNWPGYDYLYLAAEKNLFEKHGIAVKLVPVNSMTDMRMAYERGLLDGYTGTNMDVVESLLASDTPSRVVLITDFSHGGDQILADVSLTTISALKGQRVGVEITSPLSKYVLHRALELEGLKVDDIQIKPFSQSIMVEQIKRGIIDAAVTYVPYATQMRQVRPLNKLFDSTKIPGEITDLIAVSPKVLEEDPDFAKKLQAVWQDALDYAQLHPDETVAMFAGRYGLTVEAYKELVAGAKILDVAAMHELAAERKLEDSFRRAAKVLGGQLSDKVISESISLIHHEEVD